MSNDTGAQIALRTLAYLDAISEPVNIEEFVGLELTGNAEADAQLRTIALAMLQELRSMGMVSADGHAQPGSKIYGLTPLGKEMYEQFQQLVRAE